MAARQGFTGQMDLSVPPPNAQRDDNLFTPVAGQAVAIQLALTPNAIAGDPAADLHNRMAVVASSRRQIHIALVTRGKWLGRIAGVEGVFESRGRKFHRPTSYRSQPRLRCPRLTCNL